MYSEDLVQRVVNYYWKSKKSLRAVGKIFKVGKSSIWRWLTSFPTTIKKQKGKNQEVMEYIKKMVENNGHQRLKDFQEKIKSRLNLDLSISTVFRYVKSCGYSYKKRRKKTVRKNNTLEIKSLFKKEIRELGYENIWSFDKVGFQLEMSPLRGWSKRGERCYYQSRINGRKNYTGKFLVSKDGILKWELSQGGTTVNNLLEFFDLENSDQKSIFPF